MLRVNQWKSSLRELSEYGVFSGPYFPAFGLNTEYLVQMRKNTDQKKLRIWTLHAVTALKRLNFITFGKHKGKGAFDIIQTFCGIKFTSYPIAPFFVGMLWIWDAPTLLLQWIIKQLFLEFVRLFRFLSWHFCFSICFLSFLIGIHEGWITSARAWCYMKKKKARLKTIYQFRPFRKTSSKVILIVRLRLVPF